MRYDLDERLAAATSLSASERAAARFFAEHRNEVPFMSATEIAAAAGVGTATVVRAAQRLGYQGLLELKQELRAALRSRATPREPGVHTSHRAVSCGRDLLDEVVAAQIRALEVTFGSIQRAEFEQVVGLLARGDRVAILIAGPVGGLAQYLGRRLRRGGHRVLLIDTPDVSDVMVELGTGDVLVAFGFDDVNQRLSMSLDIAQKLGMPVVLVTSTLALVLRGRYDVALTVRPGDVLDHPSGVAIAAIIDALLISLTERDRRTP